MEYLEYYLVPINEASIIFQGERLKDLLYQKFPYIGELEVKAKSKILLKENEKKKEKIQNKFDSKKVKKLDKLNIPEYLIVYRYLDGSLHESETNDPIISNDIEKLKTFTVKFKEAYEYCNSSDYYNKLMNFLNKEINLEDNDTKEEKQEVKTKKKTKK